LRATTGSEVYSKNAQGRLIQLTELGFTAHATCCCERTERPCDARYAAAWLTPRRFMQGLAGARNRTCIRGCLMGECR